MSAQLSGAQRMPAGSISICPYTSVNLLIDVNQRNGIIVASSARISWRYRCGVWRNGGSVWLGVMLSIVMAASINIISVWRKRRNGVSRRIWRISNNRNVIGNHHV